MSKKQKNKIQNRESRVAASFPSNQSHNTEPSVCRCLGLIAKRTSRRATSSDVRNLVDGKYVVLHWSDAQKMDLRHGEQALIISPPSNAVSGTDYGYIATVCNIRISPSAPHSDNDVGVLSTSGRSSLSRNENNKENAMCGGVLL